MTWKSLISEVRSQDPEKVIVNTLFDQLGSRLFGGILLLAVFFKDKLPSIGQYILAPSRGWLTAALVVFFACVIFVTFFTQWGRRRRLTYLVHLLRRCKRFGHAEEMEALSTIHSTARYAALLLILTAFIALPLVMLAIFKLGMAMEVDITNAINGTHFVPKEGTKVFITIYAGIIAAFLVFILQLFDKGAQEA